MGKQIKSKKELLLEKQRQKKMAALNDVGMETLDEIVEQVDDHKKTGKRVRIEPREFHYKQSQILPEDTLAHQNIVRARHNKRHKTDKEVQDDALYQIYQFYSSQHVKRDIEFDKQRDIMKIDKGKL